jgi:alpha-beta hydrolase superfamily lysophospholipase
VSRRLDQRAKIAGYHGPVLVLHAEQDGLVDVSHGRRLAAWAGGPATLVTFERGDHNTILRENREGYLDSLAAFLSFPSRPRVPPFGR